MSFIILFIYIYLYKEDDQILRNSIRLTLMQYYIHWGGWLLNFHFNSRYSGWSRACQNFAGWFCIKCNHFFIKSQWQYITVVFDFYFKRFQSKYCTFLYLYYNHILILFTFEICLLLTITLHLLITCLSNKCCLYIFDLLYLYCCIIMPW